MKSAQIVALLALAGFSAAAQPFVYYRGVVNAASQEGPGLPGGSIARGSVFTVSGNNLGPVHAVQSGSYPLQTQLASVSVSVTQGNSTLAAIPIAVAATHVSAIMPSKAALGQAIVHVTYNNQTSNPAMVNVVEASPGLFSVLNTGFGPGVVHNNISSSNQPLNTTQSAAQPGQTVILSGTGLGPVPYSDNVKPTSGNLPTKVDVFVGNQQATVIHYSGRMSCCAGMDQIVFDIPKSAPTGCYVPVQVRTNGAVVSNAVTISINKGGSACLDTFNPAGTAIRAGGANGFVVAERADYLADTGPNAPGQVTADTLFADLRYDAGGATYFSPAYSLPPLGTCTMYSGQAVDRMTGTLFFASKSEPLDGGAALQVAAGGAAAEAGRVPGISQLYGAVLGEQPAAAGSPGLFFLSQGTFTLTIPGGVDVKAAQASGTPHASFQWIGRSSLSTLVRADGLTVSWTGGNSGTDVAVIEAESFNDAANSAALAVCVAPITAGEFSVPSEILQSLPATPASAQRIPAWVMVAAEPLLKPTTFSAGGLKGGFLLPVSEAVKSVIVQ